MRGVTLWFGFSIVLILAIDGFPLGTPQLIYQKIIPGVGNAKTIDPLITQEAAISGFLTGPYYTDISLPQILMVDTAGTHEVHGSLV